MKDVLKYISIIAGCATILSFVMQLKSCGDSNIPLTTVIVPHDRSFVPVTKSEYRPRSTPFEKKVTQSQRLPKDAPEANVARTIAIVKRIPIDSSGKFVTDTTRIVQSKSGDTFVEKQEGIETEVAVTEFLPPILQWNLFLSAGVNYSGTFSPSVAVSPLKIYDKIQFPVLSLDPASVGVGAGWCYKDFVFGISINKRFETAQNSLKLFAHYTL